MMQFSRIIRKGFTIKTILVALALTAHTLLFAQVESDERPLAIGTDGINFHKDSVFHMTLRFRMQNRFGYQSSLDAVDEDGFEASVRRLRLRLDGFVLNRKLGYYIQLSFSRSDQDLVSGTVAQTVRDAMIYYNFSKSFYIGFGQSKLPGNRERVISSGNLQFPDRSVANAVYTLDRDFGFFAYKTIEMQNSQKSILQLKGTITGGEGRGQVFTEGLAYTGRVEWLPMGRFKNLGDYSEGDLEFESKPKLSVATGYSYNDGTIRVGGQLGAILPSPVDMQTWISDVMLKYAGWGVMGEYFHRTVSDYSLDGTNDLAINRVPRGNGFNLQVSRMLAKKHEIALRYSGVNPQEGFEPYQYRLRTKALGYSYYLNRHRVKFQYYFGLDDRYNPQTVPGALYNFNNRIYTMIQVELGI
jgi:hypothetical protein